MKNYVTSCIRTILFLSILAAALLVKPGEYSAAEGSKLEGVKALDQKTDYQYDLNGDGKVETLRYQVTENDEKHEATLKLYIDKKLCLTKTSDGLLYRVYVLDLDANDNHLDLFIHAVLESDGVKNAFFVQFDGKKFVHNVPFEINKLTKKYSTYRYSIEKTDGKGNFTALLDTPIYSPAIGCYLCYVSFRMEDGNISIIPSSTYDLFKFSKEYKYKTVKAFTVYEKAGSKTAVYKVKKGDIVTFDKMYLAKSGKVYFRTINSKGSKGWILSDQEGLFAEQPAWG